MSWINCLEKHSTNILITDMSKGVYYYRDCGVVCYSLPLFAVSEFPYRDVSNTFKNALLSNGLEWCWRSNIHSDNILSNNLEIHFKPLSILTAETIDMFVSDMRYYDETNGISKGIELIGYDQGRSSLIIDEYDLKFRIALENFVSYEHGPIRIVILTSEDEDNSLVFMPHYPVSYVNIILHTWNNSWHKNNVLRQYRKLGVARIEMAYALPLIHD
jgi:hypothetical protein